MRLSPRVPLSLQKGKAECRSEALDRKDEYATNNRYHDNKYRCGDINHRFPLGSTINAAVIQTHQY